MSSEIKSVIIGTGCFVPENIVPNDQFLQHRFYETDGRPILRENAEVISGQLAEMLFSINQGNGTLGKLLRDSAIAVDFSKTMVK